MVDIRYFIFVLNADTALFTVVVFAMSYVAIRLVYRMWKSSLRCPHCGEPYKGHSASPAQETSERTLPSKLWT